MPWSLLLFYALVFIIILCPGLYHHSMPWSLSLFYALVFALAGASTEYDLACQYTYSRSLHIRQNWRICFLLMFKCMSMTLIT